MAGSTDSGKKWSSRSSLLGRLPCRLPAADPAPQLLAHGLAPSPAAAAQVGEVVESAVEAVQEVGATAQEAAGVAKSTTAAAASATKRAVSEAKEKAARSLETEEERKR